MKAVSMAQELSLPWETDRPLLLVAKACMLPYFRQRLCARKDYVLIACHHLFAIVSLFQADHTLLHGFSARNECIGLSFSLLSSQLLSRLFSPPPTEVHMSATSSDLVCRIVWSQGVCSFNVMDNKSVWPQILAS